MPVPSLITDLSTTVASNSPSGSENVFPSLDDYLRSLAGFIASIRDNSGNGWVSPYLPLAGGTVTGGTTFSSTVAMTTLSASGNVNVPSLNAGQLAGLRNHLINGGFSINQRAPATNADDTYAHDRWYALTQTGTIAVTTLTDVENGTPRMARLTQSQATAQRMGYAQIIEGINCKHLRGQAVTFEVGRVRASTSTNIRIAVLEWTGTEDSVTSDVVNSWTNTTYTAGQFFIASNLTVSSVVQQTLTANTLTDGSAVTVTLGSSFNNLIVFVWTESAVNQNVTLDLGKAQLEIGSVATPFECRSIGVELALCQRYYVKTYDVTLPPANASSNGQIGTITTSAGLAYVNFAFPVSMRIAPTTVTLYNASTGAAGTWRDGGATDRAVFTSGVGESSILVACNTAAASSSIVGHVVAIAEL